ncbi:hypothetical protein [Antrihabitans cavernicola]|uniref:Uncharacterized protein n=1 Tax=Antrihabitans cavernicola TaxID=2495913 RepID=A0A5A7S9N2_9NOCA|nr:hypothetical protein [Spelaeibacter cavernicola]KAA0022606.1 hypothetical protein FOY51_13010 [Spelaeibacter cavernicola]
MSEPLGDQEVVDVLTRVVGIIDPVLEVLSSTDPLGIKGRTKDDAPAGSLADRGLDAVAWAFNAADVPGTKAWDEKSVDERCEWWVRRVGALNNLVVAFPNVLGPLAQRLPLQKMLGFGNQAIVLIATARERGVTDRHDQVRLLAQVLCQRTIPDDVTPGPNAAAPQGEAPVTLKGSGDQEQNSWAPLALARTLWRLAHTMRGLSGELERRPKPTKIFRYLGMIPVVGVAAGYVGEFTALSHAAEAGRKWLEAQ